MVNAALANNLGNGLNRTLNLLAKFHDSAVPLDSGAWARGGGARSTGRLGGATGR